MLDTPKDIRANSIREVVSMYKSAFTNLKNGNISKFNMRYRSRKLLSEVISIPKTAIKISDDKTKFNLFTTYLKTPIKVFKELIPDINHEIKLLHDKKCNNWYKKLRSNYIHFLKFMRNINDTCIVEFII